MKKIIKRILIIIISILIVVAACITGLFLINSHVKKSVESMSGLNVTKVNVRVVGIEVVDAEKTDGTLKSAEKEEKEDSSNE